MRGSFWHKVSLITHVLFAEPEPWLRGFAPKDNNQHTPFLSGQAPNCPENSMIHPSGWFQDKNGEWFNHSVCTEGNEDEVGSAEASEEEENKK